MRCFKKKSFNYTYSLFKQRKYCMESKIIEYGIILLHKHKSEETEVKYRLFFTLVTHKLQKHLARTFKFF